MKKTILLLLATSAFACGYDDNLPPIQTPIPTTPSPTIAPTPNVRNPVCSPVERFRGGTLWKPASDHYPSCVFLIRSEFTAPFKCTIERRSGKVETLRFTGFSNGDRQTHRCGGRANEYKDNATIKCIDDFQECSFVVPGSIERRHE